jgi:pimeloyl-ACP methyl ester carboxylesterase
MGEIEKPMKIRTLMVGNPEKQKVVLVHGFGGSGAMFWKILRPLSEHYYIIMPDILG